MKRSTKSLAVMRARINQERQHDEVIVSLLGKVPAGDPDVYLRLARAAQDSTVHPPTVTIVEDGDKMAMCVVATPEGKPDVTPNLDQAKNYALSMCTGMGGLA